MGQMAGIDDCYTSARGSTGTLGNFAKATYAAVAATYAYLTPDLWKETHLPEVALPGVHGLPLEEPQARGCLQKQTYFRLMYLKCSRNKVEMSEEEIFRKFRPYCAVLASQPSAECLAKLAALCEDTAAAELELV